MKTTYRIQLNPTNGPWLPVYYDKDEGGIWSDTSWTDYATREEARQVLESLPCYPQTTMEIIRYDRG